MLYFKKKQITNFKIMAFHKKRILMSLQQDSDSERNQKREEKSKKRLPNYEGSEEANYFGDDESQPMKIVKKRMIRIPKFHKGDDTFLINSSDMKRSLSVCSKYLGDLTTSSLKISICDYSDKNEDLVNLLDSHVNILNFIYDIMELIITKDDCGIKDHYVPCSEKSEINKLFWNLINHNCVNDMIIDILDEHQDLDKTNEIKKAILTNNKDFCFPLSFIIIMCKSLRHICAFEMLLNPLIE